MLQQNQTFSEKTEKKNRSLYNCGSLSLPVKNSASAENLAVGVFGNGAEFKRFRQFEEVTVGWNETHLGFE